MLHSASFLNPTQPQGIAPFGGSQMTGLVAILDQILQLVLRSLQMAGSPMMQSTPRGALPQTSPQFGQARQSASPNLGEFLGSSQSNRPKRSRVRATEPPRPEAQPRRSPERSVPDDSPEPMGSMAEDAGPRTRRRRKRIDSRAIHTTQTYDRRYNPKGAPSSSDCVPTSLVMGLKALGKKLKGGPQRQIDRARYAMTHGFRNDRDGYVNGRRSQAEHSLGTNVDDLVRGAKRLGINANGRARSVAQAQRALKKGHPVVLFGMNSSKIWGDAHGLSRYNDAHAVLLSDYNPKTGKFTINDPLSHGGPIKITRKQLSRFRFTGQSMLGVVLKPNK